jgi:hypothetical protein
MTTPELPEPNYKPDARNISPANSMWSESQMLALRAAAFMAGMERAAEIAEKLAQEVEEESPHKNYDLIALDCAAAIRSEIAKNEQQGTERETQR